MARQAKTFNCEKPAGNWWERHAETSGEDTRLLAQISNALVDFQSVALSMPGILRIADEALSIRSVMIFEKKKPMYQVTVWYAEGIDPSELQEGIADFLRCSDSDLTQSGIEDLIASARSYALFPRRDGGGAAAADSRERTVLCPLRVEAHDSLGAIKIESTKIIGRREVAFGGSFTDLLGRALRRHHAWLEELMIREAARTELERSNAELEQFGYIVSHDLREPLRMITSYLRLLERRHQSTLDAEATEYMKFVLEGASRMKSLIDDLLHYAKVGNRRETFRNVDLNEVARIAVKNLEVSVSETNASVTVEELPTVAGRETLLVELFQNLVDNAIKFRGENSPEVHIRASRRANDWLFSVTDNGIGLEEVHAKRIFLMFQRLHTKADYPGTGIGLAVCKKIVESHGGLIYVESEPGNGAVFYFTLPESRAFRSVA